jgi:hypothetical protein
MPAHRWITSQTTASFQQAIAKVNTVVMRDREIAEVDITTFSAHSILTEDVAKKRVAAKLLMAEQK